jgi:hypothetical protein
MGLLQSREIEDFWHKSSEPIVTNMSAQFVRSNKL